jgi:hypothetical protein
MRLNFTMSDEATIDRAVQTLSGVLAAAGRNRKDYGR